ncbi:MAG: hypothetical protein MJE63_29235 [Proteobacteria bacterium]|nr:hypothetical protein [Pseudomonadota bacterium]
MEEPIKKQYIFDDENRKVAVQLDIETFEKIETILEDYSFAQLMLKNVSDDSLDLIEAEAFYKTLEKEQ